MSSSSSKEEEDPSNACRFCGRQQLPRDAFNHIKNTLHHLSPPELERRGFCCVCLNEQNILWQLITDHDDIFQMHIVEKLNGSDLKFLGQANSESRLALRRSKNVVTVPVKFDVGEFSSKETLEWAWNRWTRDEEEFCSLVCETNDLELLKWVREIKQCRWDSSTSWEAASKGNMKTLQYLFDEKCPMDEQTCAEAAENGHWEILKFLRENNVRWDSHTTSAAAREGNFEMLKWCRQGGCPWDAGTTRGACQSGHLEMLKWAMANGCMANESTMSEAAEFGRLQCLLFLRSEGVNWDYRTCKMAMEHGHRDIYEYAVENGCPTEAPEREVTHHHPHHVPHHDHPP